MSGEPTCPVCGRPKTESPGGRWVSCCLRDVPPPRRPAEVTSAVDGLARLADRALVRASVPQAGATVGCALGIATAAALALAAALVASC